VRTQRCGGIALTLEGHLRSILGALTLEQVSQDRDQFAKLVWEVPAPDIGHMGIKTLSFTIRGVYDKMDYLSSLGKTQTAVVQRDGDTSEAEAEQEAGISVKLSARRKCWT
jgi:flotillin